MPVWVESAPSVLRRIGQWLLVGEEFRPAGVSFEFAAATTWLVRVGILALVAGVGYFLKWSIEQGVLGPAARVAISAAFGLGLLVAGYRLLGKRYHLLGEAFLGGGIATLYFSTYALGPLYRLVSSNLAVFGLMTLVTVAAGVLALFSKSLLVAIVGIIGGFCTPLLLRTSSPQLAILYGYLLLLNLGILGISRRHGWRLLNYLGFLFTYGILAFSLQDYEREDFGVAITFLTLFFLVHSSLVFSHNLRKRIPCTVLEIVHLTLNAGVYSLAGGLLIRAAHGRPYPAILTFAVGLFYAAHVVWCVRGRLGDRALLLSVMALSVFYSALSMPLALEKETLTIAWALQAFLFLGIGQRLGSRFLRHLAYALYGLMMLRLMAIEFPRIGIDRAVMPSDWSLYGRLLADRIWIFGAAVGSLVAAYRTERRYMERSRDASGPGLPDIASGIGTEMAWRTFFWSMTVALFLYLHLELHVLFSLIPAWRMPALTALWCVAAYVFLQRFRGNSESSSWGAAVFFTAGAVAKTVLFDFDVWRLRFPGYFAVAYRWSVVLPRLLDFACVVALLVLGWQLLHRCDADRNRRAKGYGYASLALLLLYSTLEIHTLLRWTWPAFERGGVSVWWTLFAFGLLAGGIGRDVRPTRFAALLLFGVVILKVFLRDLAEMAVILRVAALLALGTLLLLGAFAYLRAGKQDNDRVG